MTGRNRRRERIADLITTLRENERIATQLQKEAGMRIKQTPHGPAKRPPTVDGADARLDQLHESIGSALKAAKKAGAQERTLESTRTVDPNRFPAVRHD